MHAGQVGRARPAGVPSPTRHYPLLASTYPPERPRPVLSAPAAVPKYERIDGPSGETTVGDTDTTVWTFSGTPDLIILSARSFGAQVTLTDRLDRETTRFTVLPGQPVYVQVGRERVTARNNVAGSAALLSVTGFWADKAEAGSGRQ